MPLLARVLTALFLFYALAVGLAFVFQRSLLYQPASRRPSGDELDRVGVRFWPDRDGYRGLLAAPGDGVPRATAIVFHGNAGRAIDRSYYVDALVGRGLRVILAEYPGYAGRPGSPSESNLVDDAAETLRRAREEFGGPIQLWGESLGSAVVAGVVAKLDREVDGVVLITPWDRLAAVAGRHYPLLPVRWLLRDRFDSVRALRELEAPAAVLVAEHDTIVPAARGRTLFESLGPSSRLWVFGGAGHNTWPVRSDAAWWSQVIEHVEGAKAQPSTHSAMRSKASSVDEQ